MLNSNGGPHQPPSWPPNFHPPPPQRTGPPPAKKPRNNPVITRYPPPPGYKGPAQPPHQYQTQSTWPQPQSQQFNYPQQSYPGHPTQGYGPPAVWQQPSIAGHQAHHQYPSTGYLPPNYYPAPVQPQTFPTPIPPSWPASASPPQAGAQPHWPHSHQPSVQRRHYSAPSLSGRSDSVELFESTFKPFTAQLSEGEELDDDDFYGECYFASHPEEIDLKLSLGMIEWKAPLPTKRPLPSTFAEAELEALAPRKPRSTDDESISDYFIKSKKHEASLSVRQTEYWNEVKDDIIFKEFPIICAQLLSLSELLAKYKDRPDPTWSARVYSPTPDPESDRESAVDMEIDYPPVHSVKPHDELAEESDMLGSLEQAIHMNGASHSARHSRASSVASNSSQKAPKPKALMPIRDPAQEDLLAALGVTGSPKVVYQTPGPAIGAPQQQRDRKYSRTSRHNSMASSNGGLHPPPPPPIPPTGHPPYSHIPNARGLNRRSSDASHHTAFGSDFGDQDATPRAKFDKVDTRKRAFEDSDDDSQQRRSFQDEDETPKPRRKQARV